MLLSNDEFRILREVLLRETGIEVPESKRYLFATRLDDLMEKEGLESCSQLLLHLEAGRESVLRGLIEAMTTHESGFYRDPMQFQLLLEHLLPAAAARKAGQMAPRSIRILSAGCSYGQEPYTIAICVGKWLARQDRWMPREISILGMDLSQRALERAKAGRYTDLEIGNNLLAEEKARHFESIPNGWQISDALRGQVTWRQGNLATDASLMGKFDIIFCRNVLIYFSSQRKLDVLQSLSSALLPEGVMLLGAAESLYGMDAPFEMRRIGGTTCYVNQSTHKAYHGNPDCR